MGERLQRFMIGRYGADEFSRALSMGGLICLGISMLSRFLPILSVFYWLGIFFVLYSFFRMFSRNIAARQAENRKYTAIRYRAVVKRERAKKCWAQRHIYRFYKCPGCGQRVRVPKGKGRIQITCPKCRMEFVKKS
ncbi:MAG: hypothetical protein ACI4DR_07900 [Roseburia sp.]